MSETPPKKPFVLFDQAIPLVGELVYCPTCVPIITAPDFQMGPNHLRRGFVGARDFVVYDGDTKLFWVEEAFDHPHYGGLFIREYVTNGPGPDGRMVLCGRHSPGVILRRLRHVPDGRLVRTGKIT